MSEKEKKRENKSRKETIPIPDPPATKSLSPSRPPPGFGVEPPSISISSRERRTYTLEELLLYQRDPSTQEAKELKLPQKINRNLLDAQLRKRKYPFENANRRKNGQNNDRWGKDQKWRERGSKGRKDANSIEDIEEVEEHDEQRKKNEPEPDWADADEESIKRDIKNFQFQALDRIAEREIFAQTGQIPDKPTLASPKKEPERKSEDVVDSLFRRVNATQHMPQLPKNAVDANQLEKGDASIFNKISGSAPDKVVQKPSQDKPPRSLGLFNFSEFHPRDGDDSGGELRNGFSGQQKQEREKEPRAPRQPIGSSRAEEYSRAVGAEHRSPNPQIQEQEPRLVEFELNKNVVPVEQEASGPQMSPPSSTGKKPKKHMDPVQRLENILYEVTDPVRPCVGGQFFAPARPLTNKELYDYSPKFKEIQDTRQKQVMRHNISNSRQKLMLEKYRQAERRYKASFPRDPRMKQLYDHRRMQQMEYRREAPQHRGDFSRAEYESYMKSRGHGGQPPMDHGFHR